MRFAGRTVLVLGAGGGIGAAACAALSREGARVVPADAPGSGAELIADLAEPGAAGAVVREAWERHGPLDALLHVAGLFPARRVLESTEELFDRVMAVNTRSALLAATTLAGLCAGRPAAVVFTSSGGARRPRPGTTVYAASKAALEAVTRGLALELGPRGMRVNAVAPGFVDVGSDLNPVPAGYVEAVAAGSPAGRAGTPGDVVPGLLWLCSDESAWVNGHVLAVDGGAGLGSPAAPSWLS